MSEPPSLVSMPGAASAPPRSATVPRAFAWLAARPPQGDQPAIVVNAAVA